MTETILKEVEESDESLEGKVIPFRTDFYEESGTSRTSNVLILKEGEAVGDGAYAKWVKVVDATIDSPAEESRHVHDFVIKKYFNEGSYYYTERALCNWKTLKSAGVRTWDTFRVSEDNSMILMTNGNKEGRTLLTANKNEATHAKVLEKNKLKEITGLEEMLKRLYLDVRKISQKRINVHFDTFGFLIDNEAVTKGSSDIDYLFADMDEVHVSSLVSETEKDIILNNLLSVEESLESIIEDYVARPFSEVYIKDLKDFFDKKYSEIRNEFVG